jgi:hypothetical protein
MVNTSQVRAIGHYQDNETDITVQFIDGDETNFDCGGRIVRDGILADIEEIFCPKKALFDPKEEE